MNLKTSKGFTIVELLIVIVVIAILAAISFVAYTGIQDRARDSAGEQLASQIAGKARAYHAIQGSWPTGVENNQFTPDVSATEEETDLEGALVDGGTAAPTGDSDFDNGTKVIYNANSGDPQIIHRAGTLDL